MSGGSIVITPNGNKWIGTGHNAVVTDLAGQDYFVYHAIDRADPYLDEPFGINERPMLFDRLDWIDGWPTVRGGAWASETAQPAPAGTFAVGDDFNAGIGPEWRREGVRQGRLAARKRAGRGRLRRQGAPASKPSYLVSTGTAPADVRAEADLRLPPGSAGAAGLVAGYRGPGTTSWPGSKPGRRTLVTDFIVDGRSAGKGHDGAAGRLPLRRLAQRRDRGAGLEHVRRGDGCQAGRPRSDPETHAASRGQRTGSRRRRVALREDRGR